MRFAFEASMFIALMFCVSCDRPAIDASRSLVGAKNLPPARVLSREAIQINSGFGDWGIQNDPGLLSYELRPDDTLTVTVESRHNGKGARDSFHLSPQIATRVRHSLWRLRLEKLKGVEWDTEIADCPPPPTDNFPDYAVGFIAGGPKPGVEDDRIGISVLRRIDTCNTPKATEARRLIGDSLKSFPPSKVAAEHGARLNALKAKFRS